ncbi:hypothetical protein BDZ91DRAFT_743151 [Kalaharituber pfeilii]|nr:hypothetical protein BDZ91DRAFT_743151 [Kalaharituber pfeilii]
MRAEVMPEAKQEQEIFFKSHETGKQLMRGGATRVSPVTLPADTRKQTNHDMVASKDTPTRKHKARKQQSSASKEQVDDRGDALPGSFQMPQSPQGNSTPTRRENTKKRTKRRSIHDKSIDSDRDKPGIIERDRRRYSYVLKEENETLEPVDHAVKIKKPREPASTRRSKGTDQKGRSPTVEDAVDDYDDKWNWSPEHSAYVYGKATKQGAESTSRKPSTSKAPAVKSKNTRQQALVSSSSSSSQDDDVYESPEEEILGSPASDKAQSGVFSDVISSVTSGVFSDVDSAVHNAHLLAAASAGNKQANASGAQRPGSRIGNRPSRGSASAIPQAKNSGVKKISADHGHRMGRGGGRGIA